MMMLNDLSRVSCVLCVLDFDQMVLKGVQKSLYNDLQCVLLFFSLPNGLERRPFHWIWHNKQMVLKWVQNTLNMDGLEVISWRVTPMEILVLSIEGFLPWRMKHYTIQCNGLEMSPFEESFPWRTEVSWKKSVLCCIQTDGLKMSQLDCNSQGSWKDSISDYLPYGPLWWSWN